MKITGMMKMKKLLMTLVLLPLMALANTWTDESTGYTWYYNVSGGKAEIRNSYSCAVSPKPSGSLTIPSQINGYPVVGIGEGAFEDCSGLTSVTIPSDVTSVRGGAFSDCSGLISIIIPPQVTSIEDDVFRNCSGLTSVTIPSGVTNIGDGAFCGCSGLTSVTIPSSVRSIERFAFSDCSNLMTVIIPPGVTSIEDQAFYNCSGLVSVTIPLSVTRIGGGVFRNTRLLNDHEDGLVVIDGCLIDYKGSCSGSVVIPDGVRLIADEAFSWCNLTSVKIPSSVVSIGKEAFFACYYLTSAMIAEGLTSIGPMAFYSCHNLGALTIPLSVRSIGSEAFYDCRALKSVAIPEGVSCIENNTFSGCSKLGSVTIPSSVTSIGEDAFRDTELLSTHEDGLVLVDGCLIKYKGACSGVVTIPEGVRLIAGRAFYDCNGLTSVTIPSSVASIGCHAFSGCNDLMAFIVAEGNFTYDSIDGMLYDKSQAELIRCPATKKGAVSIPSGATIIGEGAFYNCSGLTSVKMPSSVTSIAEGAFRGCNGLTSVTIPACVTRLWDTFPDAARVIKEVVLCDGTSSIGTDAFSGLNGLTSVTIPLTVTSIGNRAFYYCNGLDEMKIPASVTSIGDEAFRGCAGLRSMTIPASVTSIGQYAFYDCSGLTSLSISSGVTSIGYGAFCNCSGLKSIAIPKSVTSVGSYAFGGCTRLESITLPFIGTQRGQGDRFGTIFGSSWNVPDTLTAVTITDAVAIPNYAFEGCERIRTITLPIGVSSIGDSAFRGCESLTAISLPAGIAKIGSSAFYGCSSLSEVVIPVGVSSVESSTFYDCTSLRKVTLPVGLTEIGDSAFRNCRNLSQVNVPNTVTMIGEDAFSSCVGLGSGVVIVNDCLLTVNPFDSWSGTSGDVVIPSSVRLYANGRLFDGVGDLTSIVINAGPKEIPAFFFEGCSNLQSVVINSGIKVIGDGAFSRCVRLESVQLPEGLESVGMSAFGGCVAMESLAIPSTVSEFGGLPRSFVYDDWWGWEVVEEGTGTSKFKTVTVAAGNKTFATYNGLLYSKDGKTLYGCPSGLRAVTIRKGTKTIKSDAFRGCSLLETIEIPEGVVPEVIHFQDAWSGISYDYATAIDFWGCSSLKSVSIPSTLTAFEVPDSPVLSSLKVASGNPKYVSSGNLLYLKKQLGTPFNAGKVLVGCPRGLRAPVVSDDTKYIATAAFEGCALIETLILPASVERIGQRPFVGCKRLKTVAYGGHAPLPYHDQAWERDGWTGSTMSPDINSWDEVVDEQMAEQIREDWGLYTYAVTNVWVEDGDPWSCSRGEYVEENILLHSVESHVLKGTKGWGHSDEWQGRPLVYVGSAPDALTYYSVEFDPCGGECECVSREVAKSKSIGTLPTPTRSKYKFLGWYTAAEGGTKVSSTTKVTGDVTYYAHWTYDGSATVAVDVGRDCAEMGSVSGGKTAKAGTKVTLKATAKKGYVFAGWYRDAAGEVPVEGGADYRSPSYTYVVGEDGATFYAKFIPVAEDWVGVWCRPQDEYVRGGEIAPLAVEVNSASLATVKVTGLPTGLKFTAKAMTLKATNNRAAVDLPANTIYGTPTKSGIYTATITATTAGKKSETYKIDFVVRGDGEYLVDVMGIDGADYPDNGSDAQHAIQWGKMSGYGVFAPEKTATLKATANKGYVFAGWFSDVACVCAGGEEDDGCVYTPAEGTVDYRSTSFPVKVGYEDVLYYARFVRAEDDDRLWANVEDAYYLNGAWSLALDIESRSLPTVTVKGLPSGLKFNSKTMTIAGTPTKPGTYPITLSLKNATIKTARTQGFTLYVANIESPYLSGVDYTNDAYVYRVGTSMEFDIGSCATGGYAVTGVSGLPSGLKFNKNTGLITGVPTKAGPKTVTITLKNGNLTSSATITLNVDAIDTWAYGTFNGGGEDGVLTLTVGNTGKISGKWMTVDGTWTLSAKSYESYDEDEQGRYRSLVAAKCGTKTAHFWLDVCDGQADVYEYLPTLCGYGPLVATAKRNVWKEDYWESLAAQMKGVSFTLTDEVSLKVGAACAVTATGRFVTGQNASGRDVVCSASCSTVLVPVGEDAFSLYLCFPKKDGKFDGVTLQEVLEWNGSELAIGCAACRVGF